MAETARAATMEEFEQTPYYQGLGIKALESQLAGYQADDAALQSQAEAEYRPAYEAEKEAAKQAFEREMQSYGAQLSGMGTAYERQRKSAEQAYEQSAVEMNNQLTKRGLGRSSLVSTQGIYLQNQRNQALSEIDRAENDAINAINERIALLTEQAAQNERTMADSYARRLESRIGEMKEKNREASISLQLQIAALQQQGYEAYQEWLLKNRQQEIREKEFEAEYGEILNEEASSGSSSSSGGGGSKKPAASAKKEAEKSPGKLTEAASSAVSALSGGLKKLLDGLSNGVKASAAAQKQTTAKGASGNAAKQGGAKYGQNSFRQNMKE